MTTQPQGNWFVALAVSPGSWFDRLVPTPPAAVHRFHPADLHCTIAFLGAVGEDRARAAFASLTWPGPAMVSLAEVVPMGPPRQWSALSALLRDGREFVEAAMGRARDAMFDAAQAPRETRPPKAHVTLARLGRRASTFEREEALRWAAALRLEEVSVELTRACLYTASADRGRPATTDAPTRLFRVVDERPLG